MLACHQPFLELSRVFAFAIINQIDPLQPSQFGIAPIRKTHGIVATASGISQGSVDEPIILNGRNWSATIWVAVFRSSEQQAPGKGVCPTRLVDAGRMSLHH
jgi:hypothetical protein